MLSTYIYVYSHLSAELFLPLQISCPRFPREKRVKIEKEKTKCGINFPFVRTNQLVNHMRRLHFRNSFQQSFNVSSLVFITNKNLKAKRSV